MKKYTLVILLVLFFNLSNLRAQEETTKEENPISVSCDVMSRYVWRGLNLSSSPSIQPGIEYSKSGFTVGAWGAYATNLTSVQEADLYIGYTFNDLISVTLTDYFFPDEYADYKYFNYDTNTTGHVFETSIAFNGTDKIPFTFLLATNIYGADAQKLNADGTSNGNQYSTYAELGYTYKNINAFMGFNLTDPDEDLGETGFYGNGFGVINLGFTATKDLQITKSFSLPLSVSLVTNPQAEKIYLVAGFSF